VCDEPHTAENLKRSHYKELTIVSRAPDGSMTERKQKFCVTMQSKERDRLVAQAWKHLLGLIRDGHHGELPDVPRYISLGIDSNTQLERFATKKRARNPDDDAAAGKYTGNLPLLVINRPSLTDRF
jgi:hypothetical protein